MEKHMNDSVDKYMNNLPISYDDFYNSWHRSNYNPQVHADVTRVDFMRAVCFMSPITENIDALAEELIDVGTVYDVGAGSGFLTKELVKRGVDIIGYDLPHSTYSYVPPDGLEIIATEDIALDITSGNPAAIILSWPDYDSQFSYDVGKAALETNSTIYYLGEGKGGCTGTDNFHNLLDYSFTEVPTHLNDTYLVHAGIRDSWRKYVPKT